jgi:hypothetical protein
MLQLSQNSDWIPAGNRTRWRSMAELASSLADKNTFSRLGDSTNNGRAGLLQLEGLHRLGNKSADSAWSLGLSLRHERVSRNFNAVERFRDVEFERFWNRGLDNPVYRRPDAAEALWRGQISLNGRRNFELLNRVDAYHYSGFAAWRREHPSKPAVLKITTSGKTVKKAVAEAIVEAPKPKKVAAPKKTKTTKND